MLVFSRKKNEAIMIGEVRVVIVDINGDKVRIGIQAPLEVPVHRQEIQDRIDATMRMHEDRSAE